MRGDFYLNETSIAIAMSNINSFTKTAAGLITVGVALFASSCAPTSPESYANRLADAQTVTVHGYNGRETLNSRVYADWGAIPNNARRAMVDYAKGAEWKKADYILPQYFIQVDNSFWAVCIDARGELVGLLATQGGDDARKMEVNDTHELLVNTTDKAPALAYAILKNLAYADGLRANTRKADGLDTPVPTPPTANKPVAPVAPAPQATEEKPAEENPVAEEDEFTEEPTEETSTEEESIDDFGDDF